MAKKKSNKLIYILGGIIVILVIVALVGKKAGWIGKDKEIEVELAKAMKTTIVEKVSASGTVQPEIEVKISPDVPGEIIQLNVEEGDSVKPGELLIKIRPDNFQSALARSKANLNQQKAGLAEAKARLSRAEAQFAKAELDYKRNKQLLEQGVISDADFESTEASYLVAKQDLESARQSMRAATFTVESATASVKEAEENLSYTSILAPMGGTVSKLSVEQGERVVGTSQMAGTEMLRIADLNQMEVRVDVNENDIIKVSLGDTAIIDVDAYSHLDKEFKGVVTSIANTANQKATPDAVTEFEVRIRLLNESYKDLIEDKKRASPFRPGMTASVDIITTQKNNVLSVPLSAVTTRNPNKVRNNEDEDEQDDEEAEENRGQEDELKEVVFVKDGANAKMVQVETGISDYDNIEIKNGLMEGEVVVKGPFMVVSKKLEDGDPIKEMNKKNGSKRFGKM